jgi:hypothetical protein
MRCSLIFHAPEPGADGPALTSAGVFIAWEMLTRPRRRRL